MDSERPWFRILTCQTVFLRGEGDGDAALNKDRSAERGEPRQPGARRDRSCYSERMKANTRRPRESGPDNLHESALDEMS